jgi:hypothetical protein
MLADLHTHNSVGSRDSRVSPAELVRNLKQRRIEPYVSLIMIVTKLSRRLGRSASKKEY